MSDEGAVTAVTTPAAPGRDAGADASDGVSPEGDRPRRLSGASIPWWAGAALIGLVLVGIGLTSLDSFLLFHSLAEAFFIFVAVGVFLVAWLLREFLDDDFALFLGIGLLATAFLRLIHALDYAGMGAMDASDPDQATQLWVASALLLSVSFLVAPFFLGRRMRLPVVCGVFAAVAAGVLVTVYWWKVFPQAYDPVTGLTTFKKALEYVVCGILALAIVALVWRRRLMRPAAVPLLVSAYALTMAAELFFTVYAGVYTWPLKAGHLLMVLAAFLIYKAVVEASLARPHALAVENLRLSERAARDAQREAERTRRDFDELLELTPTFHVEAGYAETARAVCRGARKMFECQSATLFAATGNEIVVEAREPHAALMRPGVNFDIADDVELRRLVRTRSPSFLPDANVHPLLPLGVDRRVTARAESALRVPIGVGPTADRVLILVWGETRSAPDPMLLALVQRFADHAGAALALAGRRDLQEETQRLYRRLEDSLMPTQRVQRDDLTVATRYRAGERGMRIGGDFIGVVERDDGRVSVVVGDVSGHGPDAAALGATLRGSWRALALAGVGWQTMLDTLAAVLISERPHADYLVTLCAATIDPAAGSAEIVNVAHPQPLLLAKGVAPVAVEPYPPLGAFESAVWEATTVALPAPWKLLLYSDGLIEARSGPEPGERLGVEGLVGLVAAEYPGRWDDEALDRIMATAEGGGGAPFADDVAVVLVSSRD